MLDMYANTCSSFYQRNNKCRICMWENVYQMKYWYNHFKVTSRVKTNTAVTTKTLPFIILAKKLKPILCRVLKGT